MPSGTAIRRGTIVAVPLSLVLLSGAPAFAATLAPGDPCTTSSALGQGLTCVNGVVTESTAPSPSATPSDGVAVPEPSATPDTSTSSQLPVGAVASAAPSQPPTGSTTAGGTTTGTTSGLSAGKTAPELAAPSTATAAPPTSVAGSPTDRPSPPSARSAGTGAQGTTGTTLLGAADLAMAPPGDLPSQGAVRSVTVRRLLDPGAVQSPELAGLPLASLPPAQAVTAVQSPLLAVGQQAAGGGGFRLLGLTSHTLPGILIALATALVAAVGAGNVRAWQARLATRRRAARRSPKPQALAS